MAYQTLDPTTGTLVKTFENISDENLEQKLMLADKAFNEWRFMPWQNKQEIFVKLAGILENEKKSHASLITLEMGKPFAQAVSEVEKCAWICRYYAENAENILKPLDLKSTAKQSWVRFEPMGIIYAVMPWNFPYWQVFRFLVPTLISGNVGLLKHASNVPQCADAIEKVLLEAGAPEGIFQNLFIGYGQSENLIKSPLIKGVTLTGSNLAGSRVAELAGKYIKKTVLELGGSDPFIVFDDASLEKSVEMGILSRFLNTGQSCIAAKRFLVQENIYPEFVKLFTDHVGNLVVGDPWQPETFIGPLARKEMVNELVEQVHQSELAGAKVLYGGKALRGDGNFFLPTVIVDAPLDCPVSREELFGPVAPIYKFKTLEEAAVLANDTPFGLGAAIWTRDVNKAMRLSELLLTGTVAINGMVKSEPSLPFGGVKDSGYGRELGEFGIREFLNIKTLNVF